MSILHRKKDENFNEEATKDACLTLLEEIKSTKGCLTASIIFSKNWTPVLKQLIK